MNNNKKGKLIVVEGGDFVGKSTFIEKLKLVKPDFMYTREPGNKLNTTHASMCEQIRQELLTQNNSLQKEAQLLAASRLLHTMDIVELLKKGHNVVVDRYILSSFAYQAYASKLGYLKVMDYNKSALSMLEEEDIEINMLIFKVDKDSLEQRKKARESTTQLDVIEQRGEEFFNRVNSFFNENLFYSFISTLKCNVYEVDTSAKTKGEVFAEAYNHINTIINK